MERPLEQPQEELPKRRRQQTAAFSAPPCRTQKAVKQQHPSPLVQAAPITGTEKRAELKTLAWRATASAPVLGQH